MVYEPLYHDLQKRRAYAYASSFRYFGRVFNKTIIPLALVGYEMIIANSALRASLAIYHLISNKREWNNRPRSIYQYCSMAPRLSGQNCKLFKFLLSLNSQKRLGYKENNKLLMTGPEGNSVFCFPRISMFPETKSRETKFTVPQGASH